MQRSAVCFLFILMLVMPLMAGCILEPSVSEIHLPVPGELVVVRDTDDNDRGELYLINADGSNIQRIMEDQGYGMPVWSPDGRKLATIVSISSGTYPVVVVELHSMSARAISTLDGDFSDVAWSPDGQQIVFSGFDHASVPVEPTPATSGEPASPGVIYPQVYIAQADGTNVRRLFDDIPEGFQQPAWSPDGEKLVYVGSGAQLWIADLDGSNRVQASTGLHSIFFPIWSPDSSKIAFVGYPDEHPGIYIVDSDGTNLQRVVPDDVNGWMPAWSPDGEEIVFGHFVSNGYELRVVNLATGEIRERASVRARSIAPSWSPDGEWIAFTAEMGLGERSGAVHLSIVSAHDPDPKAETIVRDLMSVSRPEWRPPAR